MARHDVAQWLATNAGETIEAVRQESECSGIMRVMSHSDPGDAGTASALDGGESGAAGHARAVATSAWDDDRLTLRDALASLPGDLGSLYSQAVELLGDPQGRVQLMLLAHCVRELVNSLPDSLGEGEKVDVPKRSRESAAVETLCRAWNDTGMADAVEPPARRLESHPRAIESGNEGPQPLEVAAIPEVLMAAVEDVVRERTRGGAIANRRYAYVVGVIPEPELPTVHLLRRQVDFFVAWVHLDRSRNRALPEAETVREHFRAIEQVLTARLGGFFATTARVRQLLDDANRRSSTGGD